MTIGPEVRFRAITRARFLVLETNRRFEALNELYSDNLERLFNALEFCRENSIHLFRATSSLFPLNDEPEGMQVLDSMAARMAEFNTLATSYAIRVVIHPDQFVVLNSETPRVVEQSIHLVSRQAHIFDLLGLPRTPWSAIILHGGKSGRASELVELIPQLPKNVRNRLVLENDERAYSAAETLHICQSAGVPMVFDNHHHVVREGLQNYEDPSLRSFVEAARETWPDPQWQLVHLSNGREFFADPRHSDVIRAVPSAFLDVPWIEVEAKSKECAVLQLQPRIEAMARLRYRSHSRRNQTA